MCKKLFHRNKLYRDCDTSLSAIAEELKKASVQIPPDKIAWGQFLDYPHSTDQIGVYGTATVIKTLSIIGEPNDSDNIQGGINWLLHSYNDADSRASIKKDWGVTYKLCYLLEALEPNNQEINEESGFARYFHILIGRILPDDGWGEYYYSNTIKDSNVGLIATAMALYVLRRFVPFSGSTKSRDIVSRFSQKVLGLENPNSITIALSVIVAASYVSKHQMLRSDLIRLAVRLEEKVKKIGKNPSLSEYHHHFTVESEETEQWNNKYIFLPINAIVAYALILSDRYKDNKNYIDKVISHYISKISSYKAYCDPEEAPRKSTVNQYWVALLLNSYREIKPVGRVESLLSSIKCNRWIYYPLLIIISIVILGVLFLTIPILQRNPALNALPAILIIIADLIIHRIWYKGN